MKNRIKSVLLLTVCILFYNISSAQVTSQSAPGVDFTKYKTYSFGGWQHDSDQVLNQIDKNNILQSLKAQFTSRGMTYQETGGEAIITLYIVVKNETSTTAYTTFNGGFGGGFYRPAWGWGMGSATTTYNENDYQVGTFVVDVYDATSKNLLWQGVSTKTINSNASKRSKTIPKGIAKLMSKYPIQPLKS
jgi:hypothetical protein